MTPDFVAVPRDATADEAIAAIRRLVDEAETVNYVYVVDAERHLLGVLSLYRLMLSPADTPVTELMAPTTVRVRADRRPGDRGQPPDRTQPPRDPGRRRRRTTSSGSSPRTTSPTSSRPRRPRTSSGSAARSR